MAAALDVVVIGSCMIDLVSYVPTLPKPGETIHGTSFSQGFGGKGANQCVMAALLGSRCAMVGKLGEDDFGRSTLKNFKENGINSDYVMSTGEASSGVASITVNDRGENAIVIVAGANTLMTPKEVGTARDLVARAKVVVCQLEVEPETTLAALEMARKLGVITILNTAPALKGLRREFFENSDILCLNETEAEILTGMAVSDFPSASAAVVSLQCTGTRCVVLTLGEKGLVYSILVEEQGSPRWTEPQHMPAGEVTVVDTTGAGDAFVGALAHFLASFLSSPGAGTWRDPVTFSKFLQLSREIASASVMFKGTQTSFKRIDLQSFKT